jgi:hypothetical protein
MASCFAAVAIVAGALLLCGVMTFAAAMPIVGYFAFVAIFSYCCALYMQIQKQLDAEDANYYYEDDEDVQTDANGVANEVDLINSEVNEDEHAETVDKLPVRRNLHVNKSASISTLPRMAKMSRAELNAIKTLFYSGSIKGSGVRKNIHIFQTETGKILRTSRVSFIRKMPNLEKITVRSEQELCKIAKAFNGIAGKRSLQVCIDGSKGAA